LLVEVDSLLELNAVKRKDFGSLNWQLYDPNGKAWFWFNINQEGVADGKVNKLTIAFDGDFQQWPSPAEERQIALLIAKYRQLQELFRGLNADVLCGWTDRFMGGYKPPELDPSCENQVFRFAKTGRQILVAPMEEGRVRRDGEDNWRIIVDTQN